MDNFRKLRVERTEDYYIYKGKQLDAGQKLNQAVKEGRILKRKSCMICGSDAKINGHHYLGYDHPYDVWWLCHRCNILLPIHDGSFSLRQAKVYVINRTRYNDYYRLRGTGFSDGSDIDSAAKFVATHYIDFNLARHKDKLSDLPEMVNGYFDKMRSTSTVVVRSTRRNSKRHLYDSLQVYNGPVFNFSSRDEWVWDCSVELAYITIWGSGVYAKLDDFKDKRNFGMDMDFIPMSNGEILGAMFEKV